jgi:hypothetical protein
MNDRSRHRGYVLLVALALTALAAVVVVGLSRVAMERIVYARQAAEDLQRKWGVVSCRAALLPYAEQLLSAADVRVNPKDGPVVVQAETIELGRMRFDLRIGDEQAKVNVNAMLQTRSPSDADRDLGRLLSGSGVGGRVRLIEQDANPWSIGSFGQVFPGMHPADLLGEGSEHMPAKPPAVDRITCWGSGKLNVRRASAEALEELLAPELSAVRIAPAVELRQQMRDQARQQQDEQPPQELSVDQFLQTVQAEAEQEKVLRGMLTDRSRCWSLWVTVRSPSRSWRWLMVREILGRQTERVTAFQW